MATECYKILQTNLEYLNVDTHHKVLLFTSAVSVEGKSTSISNVAVTLAQSGRKVLLMDCDLRKAKLHDMFGLNLVPGLTNILSHKKSIKESANYLEGQRNLHILTAGALPPDPLKHISSNSLKNLIQQAKESYDYVLIDAPPVLAVADTARLARCVDGVILVVAANETKQKNALQAKKALDKTGVEILGCILTKQEIKNKGYYTYYSKEQIR